MTMPWYGIVVVVAVVYLWVGVILCAATGWPASLIPVWPLLWIRRAWRDWKDKP